MLYQLTERQKELLRMLVPGLKDGTVKYNWAIHRTLDGKTHISQGIDDSAIRQQWEAELGDHYPVLENYGFFRTGRGSVHLHPQKIIDAVEDNFGETQPTSGGEMTNLQFSEKQKMLLKLLAPKLKNGLVKDEWIISEASDGMAIFGLDDGGELYRAGWKDATQADLITFADAGLMKIGRYSNDRPSQYYLYTQRIIEVVENEFRVQTSQDTGSNERGNRVFIVHGHDNEAKESVARVVEKLGLEAVILHEKPNKGQTVIEKLESNAEKAGFAVVLLTPDDMGRLNKDGESENPRARQNVILELGFFLGQIGRENVCALFKEGVEIPSDYNGVLWVKFDKDGSWRLRLAMEMKAAGLEVDLNRLST